MKIGKIRSMITDMGLNVIASFVLTGSSQLILYPTLAKQLDAASYGVVLTIMGLINVVSISFGTNLSYARLLLQKQYEEEGVVGDYQILLTLYSVFAIVLTGVVCLYMNLPFWLIIEILIATWILALQNYYLVTFRITINYKSNLMTHIIIGGIYVLSVCLLRYMSWPWIFSLGGFAGLIYIWFHSDIICEPFKKTKFFWSTLKKSVVLISSGLMGNMITYLDRFIIFPVLGGASVAIYNTSAFFSKSLSLIMAPVSGVILSYLTQKRIVLNKKKYCFINLLFIVLAILFWIISGNNNIGGGITRILYPSLYEESKKYILLASLGNLLGIINGVNANVIMTVAPIVWQTTLQTIKFILYFVLGFFFVNRFGIVGLCVALVIINAISYLLTFFVGMYYIKNKENG